MKNVKVAQMLRAMLIHPLEKEELSYANIARHISIIKLVLLTVFTGTNVHVHCVCDFKSNASLM